MAPNSGRSLRGSCRGSGCSGLVNLVRLLDYCMAHDIEKGMGTDRFFPQPWYSYSPHYPASQYRAHWPRFSFENEVMWWDARWNVVVLFGREVAAKSSKLMFTRDTGIHLSYTVTAV